MAVIGAFMARYKLWQAIRIVSSCALAYIVTGLLALPDGYWAVITAIVVTQADFGATLQAGRDRILGTVIGALAGFLVIETSLGGYALDTLFWVALAPLAILTALKPNLRLSCVTLVVVVLIPSTSSWHRPLDRVIEILLGTLASIIVSAILFPRKAVARVATPTPAEDGAE
jgi:uncharacterized membrane protein YccC